MELTEQNFVVYAATHYTNQLCLSQKEFFDDLNKIKYIKKLFFKYKESGEIKEKLILNHIIIIHNVFGVDAGNKLLISKLKEYYSSLKPFLIYLKCSPDFYDKTPSNIICMDELIVNKLREINKW